MLSTENLRLFIGTLLIRANGTRGNLINPLINRDITDLHSALGHA